MNTKLEKATEAYWNVSNAVRHIDNNTGMCCKEALDAVRISDTLLPENWRLMEHMHVLRHDIIEGNKDWRGGGTHPSRAPVLHFTPPTTHSHGLKQAQRS